MPTYRTNALYQAPTVDNAVYEQFGMQPGMDRLNLLPRHDAKLGWIAPNALYQIARAIVSPGVAARGGYVSPEDGVNFAGNVSLGSLGTSALMKRPAPGPGRTVAQTVYHGSPHNFDKFDMSKIGTGEGAQAYGHGLYVAESPTVAKSYTTAGTGGVAFRGLDPSKYGMDDAIAKKIAKNWMDYKKVNPNEFHRFKVKSPKTGADHLLNDIIDGKVTEGGNLYHVDLPDHHIANMLDWDKPLSQQPELLARLNAVADRLPSNLTVNVASGTKVKSNLTGAEFYNRLSGNPDPLAAIGPRPPAGKAIMGAAGAPGIMEYSESGQAAASKALNKIGIPGIKYLDGGSRGAGDGTRNFAVFDDNLLNILKKE